MSHETSKKVMVIGVDAATFDLITPWTKQGKLATFKKLMDRGASGELISTVPPITAPAWTSMVTGKNPGKHGIFDFTKRNVNGYEVTIRSSLDRDADAIWNILSRKGKKVVVMNIPFTYPPEKVNGVMISGIPAPESRKDFTYPKQLLRELEREVGNYRIWYRVEPGKRSIESFTDDICEMIKAKGEAARYLMAKDEWNFFMVNFQETDWVQHFFWNRMNQKDFENSFENESKYDCPIETTYLKIDEEISKMLEIVDEDTYIFIVSDHGAGPLEKNVYFNNWLVANGLLTYKKTLKYLMFKMGFTSENIYKILVKFHLADIIPRIREKKSFLLKRFLTLSDVDWSRTKAYSIGLEGNIFINVKGREPQGIVDSGEEYEHVRRNIINRLREFRDPETDELIFDEVYLKEQVFSGKHLNEAPDIVLLLTRYHQDVKFVSKSLIGPPPDGISGNHRMNGVIIIDGPNVRECELLTHANLLDVAPTILHIMGLSIPDDMDGKVLVDAFEFE